MTESFSILCFRKTVFTFTLSPVSSSFILVILLWVWNSSFLTLQDKVKKSIFLQDGPCDKPAWWHINRIVFPRGENVEENPFFIGVKEEKAGFWCGRWWIVGGRESICCVNTKEMGSSTDRGRRKKTIHDRIYKCLFATLTVYRLSIIPGISYFPNSIIHYDLCRGSDRTDIE